MYDCMCRALYTIYAHQVFFVSDKIENKQGKKFKLKYDAHNMHNNNTNMFPKKVLYIQRVCM